MSIRGVIACLGLAAAVVVMPAGPSSAASDLYVATPDHGGDDGHDCSQASPCATVARALSVADASGTTIHVGAGTFSGGVDPGGKNVDIVGDSTAGTVLTNSFVDNQVDTWTVVTAGSGTLGLSDLTVQGALSADVLVFGTGSVVADHVALTDGGCELAVLAGSASLADSTVEGGGASQCDADASGATGQIQVFDGSVSLQRTRVLDPASGGHPSVTVAGGAFTADQSYLDDSDNPLDTNDSSGVTITGGLAALTRSTVHGYGSAGIDNQGGSALVSDATLQGNVVGVNGDASGTTTVLRSTFEHELASLQGNVSVAGSVLGSLLGTPRIGIQECAPSPAAVTDLGYNLSSDASCGFTEATSHASLSAAELGLDDGVADRGGPVPTVATLWPSKAVDSIPTGTTYGPAETSLCPATASTDLTDLRGVPRSQGGACDAGSMELVATGTTLRAPATARPHAGVGLVATVTVPDVGVGGVDGGEPATGTVTFLAGSTVLCPGVTVQAGAASCATTALAAGRRTVTAAFTPADGSTLDASTSQPSSIVVGTTPSFTSPATARFVAGKAHTFRVRASGVPAPRITLVKGSLPAGLHFTAGRGSATVSGTAKKSAVGTHSVTLQAQNLRGTDHQVLRIVITRS